jgi:NAD(P)-dependent dehydrogenase (short-subunit alcohol dehydrogenase family)
MKTSQEKQTVLVTGAASGLGKAIALALKAQGFSVFGTSRRPEERSASGELPILQLDVRSDDSVRAAFEQLRARAGRLDVLVNNAGFRLLGAAEETSVDEAKAVFDSPGLRYRVGPDATWLPRLKLLPWSWYERGIRWRYGLDGPAR